MSALEENFGWLMRNVKNLKPLLNEVGFAGVNELKQNFVVGGRPNKWDQSGRVKVFGGETLRDTGKLMNSMTHQIDSPISVLIGPGVPFLQHKLDSYFLAELLSRNEASI